MGHWFLQPLPRSRASQSRIFRLRAWQAKPCRGRRSDEQHSWLSVSSSWYKLLAASQLCLGSWQCWAARLSLATQPLLQLLNHEQTLLLGLVITLLSRLWAAPLQRRRSRCMLQPAKLALRCCPLRAAAAASPSRAMAMATA